jgi:4-amino-4-deoxy-L-arabinose transferase-like glycosyltransferase
MTSVRLESSRYAADALAVLTLLVLAVIGAATFRDYGLGWDDFTHAQMGEKLLSLYGSGFRDTEALSFVNLYYYGGGFDMLAALLAKATAMPLFDARRLCGAMVGLVGLFTVWRIGRRVGGPLAGLMALLLLATCPIFFGHMFINAKDAPFAVAMAVLLLGLVRLIEEYPHPSPATVLLFGTALGLTLGTRIIGGIAVLFAGAAFLFLLATEARRDGLRPAAVRLGRFLVRLLPGFAVAYLVLGLVWPWAIVEPLNPLRALVYFSDFFEKPWREVFNGRLISVPDMPASYLPTLLGLQLPEIMTTLALGGIALLLWRLPQAAFDAHRRAVYLLLVTAALAPIALAMATRPAMYNGFRHFLFLLPPIAVLGGICGAALLGYAQRHGRFAAPALATVMGLALASPAIEMVRLHPYEYTHFNRIEGGVGAAENEYMLDYWGLSFKQAAQQLRATLARQLDTPPAGRRWKIAVCGPHPAAAVELGPEFELTWDPRGADFALMLGTYYCTQFTAPVLAEVQRAGVTYARAYDIRERAYSTILTNPPPQ